MSAAPWWDGPLVGFDTETTGPDPQGARIVTACLVVDSPGAAPAVTSWLINPGVEIPAGATAVHGITTEHAQTHGVDPLQAVAEIADALDAHQRAGTPLVAFNAAFDFTVLDRECRRLGMPAFVPDVVLDPFVLDKQVDRYRRGKRTLSVTCEVYGVELEAAHSADADALAAVQLARAIGRREPHPPADAVDLHARQVVWRREQQESLAEYFRSRGQAADVDPTWPVHPVRELSGTGVS